MGLDELAASAAPPVDTERLEQKFRSGANWFYWIAGLSVVNSVIQLLGSGWSFIVGLGLTQVFDGFAAGAAEGNAGPAIRAIALLMDLVVAGFFCVLAWQAGKRRAWAFVLGGALYALDGPIFVLFQDWLGLAFHGFALYCLWLGYSSLKGLQDRLVQLGERPIEPGAA